MIQRYFKTGIYLQGREEWLMLLTTEMYLQLMLRKNNMISTTKMTAYFRGTSARNSLERYRANMYGTIGMYRWMRNEKRKMKREVPLH